MRSPTSQRCSRSRAGGRRHLSRLRRLGNCMSGRETSPRSHGRVRPWKSSPSGRPLVDRAERSQDIRPRRPFGDREGAREMPDDDTPKPHVKAHLDKNGVEWKDLKGKTRKALNKFSETEI